MLQSRFVRCAAYLATVGVISFVMGRVIPYRWLNENRIPFRSFRFEQNGKLYQRLHIRAWQNRLPDMSRILSGMMPLKKVGRDMANSLPTMIKETCVAELIHVLLCVAGLYCIRLWPGPGGKIIAALYMAGNIPFILVQRYNRPRLLLLMQKMQSKNNRNGLDTKNEDADSELQYGSGT